MFHREQGSEPGKPQISERPYDEHKEEASHHSYSSFPGGFGSGIQCVAGPYSSS